VKAHTRIVLHGKQADNASLRTAISALRDQGISVDVAVTWEPGDAIRLTEEAIRLGVGNVVAAGGDGSINAVVQGMANQAAREEKADLPTLGILPLGTANDFARSASIPSDLELALGVACLGTPFPVDVAHHGKRAFLNVATGGFGTEVTTDTPENLKKVLGAAAYFITGLVKLGAVASKHARVSVGDFSWQGRFVMIGIGNARAAGGGRLLCPDAIIDDGLLDVALLPQQSEEELPSVLGELSRSGFGAFGEHVVFARGAHVRLESEEELTLNFDGEPVTERSFSLEVWPRLVEVRLPDDCPLLTDSFRAGGSSEEPNGA